MTKLYLLLFSWLVARALQYTVPLPPETAVDDSFRLSPSLFSHEVYGNYES